MPNKRKKSKKVFVKNLKLKSLVFFVFMVSFASIFLFQKPIYRFLNGETKTTFSDVISSPVSLHFINVGQGDAIAINLPDGKVMLIDSGTDEAKANLIDYLKKNVLKANSVKIDYFIITHPHADHIGGGLEVFEEFEIETVFRPNVFSPQEKLEIEAEGGYVPTNNVFELDLFESLVNAIAAEGSNVEFFSSYNLPEIVGENGYKFSFLTPNAYNYSNLNNYSPLLLLEYKNQKALFTGDAEAEIESYAVTNLHTKLTGIDILKVGHHGSNTSSSKAFITMLSPKYAVIQVGKDNGYGHPSATALSNFASVNTKVYRTDLQGNIVLGLREFEIFAFSQNLANGGRRVQVWQIYLVGSMIGFYVVFLSKWKIFDKMDNNN